MAISQAEEVRSALNLVQDECETVTVNKLGEVIRRQNHQIRTYEQPLEDGVTLGMVSIPEGRFMMGTLGAGGYEDEHPRHSVEMPSFMMGKYPVTQEQWSAIMNWEPPYRCRGDKRPVDRVSWDDALEFCKRLSRKAGKVYGLPSESQWEYACRARTTTPFYFGETITTELANYVGAHIFQSEPEGSYRHETTEVGVFPPNAFGLYDMHGNVWEWCADDWHDNYVGAPGDGSAWKTSRETKDRVLRGGSWHEPPQNCRSATRLKQNVREREDFFGFRVVMFDQAGDDDATGISGMYEIMTNLRKWFIRR